LTVVRTIRYHKINEQASVVVRKCCIGTKKEKRFDTAC
jgi:hypothetical protein